VPAATKPVNLINDPFDPLPRERGWVDAGTRAANLVFTNAVEVAVRFEEVEQRRRRSSSNGDDGVTGTNDARTPFCDQAGGVTDNDSALKARGWIDEQRSDPEVGADSNKLQHGDRIEDDRNAKCRDEFPAGDLHGVQLSVSRRDTTAFGAEASAHCADIGAETPLFGAENDVVGISFATETKELSIIRRTRKTSLKEARDVLLI
jgi:hypothetical protein